jgi:prepilin-type N-terminal cleavage/methylation domain-containing protein/prepilin-type processing-associated H-X9-DG protein
MDRGRAAFTLIELMLVILVVAIMIAIVVPALASARTHARVMLCGTRLEQLSVATSLYLNDYSGALPQARGPTLDGTQDIIGALFGGKKGALPLFNVDQFGIERRPLNSYVHTAPTPSDLEKRSFELEPFRSPMDKGAQQTYLPLADFQSTESIYDLWGSSYVINDHTLDGDAFKTLIPPGGGKMPFIQDPTKTWLLGSHTIYNFQQDSDRGEYWYDSRVARANLAFVDGHVRLRVRIPDEPCEVENTTWDYTFLPVAEPTATAPGCRQPRE